MEAEGRDKEESEREQKDAHAARLQILTRSSSSAESEKARKEVLNESSDQVASYLFELYKNGENSPAVKNANAILQEMSKDFTKNLLPVFDRQVTDQNIQILRNILIGLAEFGEELPLEVSDRILSFYKKHSLQTESAYHDKYLMIPTADALIAAGQIQSLVEFVEGEDRNSGAYQFFATALTDSDERAAPAARLLAKNYRYSKSDEEKALLSIGAAATSGILDVILNDSRSLSIWTPTFEDDSRPYNAGLARVLATIVEPGSNEWVQLLRFDKVSRSDRQHLVIWETGVFVLYFMSEEDGDEVIVSSLESDSPIEQMNAAKAALAFVEAGKPASTELKLALSDYLRKIEERRAQNLRLATSAGELPYSMFDTQGEANVIQALKHF